MQPTLPSKYNIRVYGILINEQKEVLVSDEYRLGTYMTKFPGGGHHLGEGLAECVQREWQEELSVEVSADKLFYINDFLQVSAFDKRDQILAVYYKVSLQKNPLPPVSSKRFDFEAEEGAQSFRWIPLSEISEGDFTFPIDKKVGNMLRIAP